MLFKIAIRVLIGIVLYVGGIAFFVRVFAMPPSEPREKK